eukprot:TRINITY_DN67368_c0_g1_i2.p1 TRINITY_DN67368_c0_g1~~TRINITY_DN67368_c0_g1_i2.p1  ORF type:complete len:419 (+),score=13.80 TRINITY_DN67368_c0_g1_i2:79-1335(+)
MTIWNKLKKRNGGGKEAVVSPPTSPRQDVVIVRPESPIVVSPPYIPQHPTGTNDEAAYDDYSSDYTSGSSYSGSDYGDYADYDYGEHTHNLSGDAVERATSPLSKGSALLAHETPSDPVEYSYARAGGRFSSSRPPGPPGPHPGHGPPGPGRHGRLPGPPGAPPHGRPPGPHHGPPRPHHHGRPPHGRHGRPGRPPGSRPSRSRRRHRPPGHGHGYPPGPGFPMGPISPGIGSTIGEMSLHLSQWQTSMDGLAGAMAREQRGLEDEKRMFDDWRFQHQQEMNHQVMELNRRERELQQYREDLTAYEAELQQHERSLYTQQQNLTAATGSFNSHMETAKVANQSANQRLMEEERRLQMVAQELERHRTEMQNSQWRRSPHGRFSSPPPPRTPPLMSPMMMSPHAMSPSPPPPPMPLMPR